MNRDRPYVLLLWPGGLFAPDASFGVPQLLCLAGALANDAIVDVVDLNMERARGAVDLRRIAERRRYTLVGIAAYSSFEYLKVRAIALHFRELIPEATIVVGGYHASARPLDFLDADSPIDHVVVGDGERPLQAIMQSVIRGVRYPGAVVGPLPTMQMSEQPPYDWSLLEQYRTLARTGRRQAEIYLSRGCPFDCSFCMESAKRETSWRPLPPLRAVEELHRLDAFLDLSGFTLFIADALFGMQTSWRRAFLEELIRRPIRADKIWALIRLDLLEREDLELFARANMAPGFGLESGDAAHLLRIRKTGRLHGYLDKMREVAGWAREYGVPWGANIIVGHPGETEGSLRTTAQYLKKLYLSDPAGTTGFLSVDPFRLYPGSPIDRDLESWRRETGMRAHRYPWWHDGDQDFLSEWVDPSESLSYRDRLTLTHELFAPIVSDISGHYRYDGSAADYFRRALSSQVELMSPTRLHRTLAQHYLWSELLESRSTEDALAQDAQFAGLCCELRKESLEPLVSGTWCPTPLSGSGPRKPEGSLFDTSRVGSIVDALIETPRERFVRTEDLAASTADRPLSLTDDGGSTISAMHAYYYSFAALGLRAGDRLADLGAGTGYGVALASRLVGPSGSVVGVEWVDDLAEKGHRLVSSLGNCRIVAGDAHDTSLWGSPNRVSVDFELSEVPAAFLAALPDGGTLVAPVRGKLVRYEKCADGTIRETELLAVRYVPDRATPLA